MSTPQVASSAADPTVLIQIHTAEYATLTNRITYFILAQYSFLPLFLAACGVGAELFKDHAKLVIWGILAVAQILGIYFHVSEAEIYKIIAHLENRLRPQIERLMGSAPFWEYEQKLDKPKAPYWETPVLLGSGLVNTVLLIFLWPQTFGEKCGVLINLALFMAVVFSFKVMRAARRSIFDKKHASQSRS